MINKEILNNIANALAKVFKGDSFRLNAAYGGMSMSVQGTDNETYVYFRIAPFRNNKVIVEISNIELDESIQRKGYFTRLIKELSKIKGIDRIIVQNILSEEMALACIKNNFKESNYYNGYELVVNG